MQYSTQFYSALLFWALHDISQYPVLQLLQHFDPRWTTIKNIWFDNILFLTITNKMYFWSHSFILFNLGHVCDILKNKNPIILLLSHSYLKTSIPHPAMAVNSRGPRSLAGFRGYPQFRSMDTPMAMMTSPMARGSTPLGAPMFPPSMMARIHRTSIPVPTTWRNRGRGWTQHFTLM